MVAKKKSKFDNKFKSTTPADSRTANVRTERKVKDDLPKLSPALRRTIIKYIIEDIGWINGSH